MSVIDSARPVDLRSLTLSVVVHALFLLALILFWSRMNQAGTEEAPRRVAIVLASADDQPKYFDENDPAVEPSELSPDQATALPVTEPPPVDLLDHPDQLTPLDLPIPGFDASAIANVPNRTNSSNAITLSEEQQRLLDAERAAFEARRPKGPPTTIQVFGSADLTGRRFVFVIDRSRSMGGQGLNALAAAAAELNRAIDQLQDHHEFQIVAYNENTTAIGRRILLPATAANKSLVHSFVDELAAFGSTEHEGALMVALGFDPDVIVLLNDGGLPDLNESQLLRIRRAAGPTQIHCVQFGSGPAQQETTFMKRLANQNDGSFRYVDMRTWPDQ